MQITVLIIYIKKWLTKYNFLSTFISKVFSSNWVIPFCDENFDISELECIYAMMKTAVGPPSSERNLMFWNTRTISYTQSHSVSSAVGLQIHPEILSEKGFIKISS